MPTLREILAAKEAKVVPTHMEQFMDHMIAEAKEQMLAPHVASIKAADEKAKLSASIKQTMDDLAPKIQPSALQPRVLGAMTEGERIPLLYPTADSPLSDKEWFASMHAFQSDLCIVLDSTNPEQAWLAVKRNKHHPFPLLLHKLPLFPMPSEPF